MSDNNERILLDPEMEEQIAGGRLVYESWKDGYHIYSPSDPGTLYTFVDSDPYNVLAIKKYEKQQCQGMTDAEVIQLFLDNQWIIPR